MNGRRTRAIAGEAWVGEAEGGKRVGERGMEDQSRQEKEISAACVGFRHVLREEAHENKSLLKTPTETYKYDSSGGFPAVLLTFLFIKMGVTGIICYGLASLPSYAYYGGETATYVACVQDILVA